MVKIAVIGCGLMGIKIAGKLIHLVHMLSFRIEREVARSATFCQPVLTEVAQHNRQQSLLKCCLLC